MLQSMGLTSDRQIHVESYPAALAEALLFTSNLAALLGSQAATNDKNQSNAEGLQHLLRHRTWHKKPQQKASAAEAATDACTTDTKRASKNNKTARPAGDYSAEDGRYPKSRPVGATKGQKETLRSQKPTNQDPIARKRN